jgi:hypothetical protein
MKYSTLEKKIKTLHTEGNIITFKSPFYWKGDPFIQILVSELLISGHKVKLIGKGRDTKWFDDIEELIESVDWEWMDRNHLD